MAIPEACYRGLAYRAHHPGWAWNAESGEGARLHGGRFNPKGVAALYLSLRYETAWAEAQQAFPFKPQPMTLCAYEVDCERIVDLRDPSVCQQLGILPEQLSCAWEDLQSRSQTPPTHAIALRLMRAGSQGILVPSFAPGAPHQAINLVLWTWSRKFPHKVHCIDDHDRLQKPSTSVDVE
ncbi:MAG: RES family NAD+ phosphorylase [Wenzhouxiangellaceae bacterium]